jgi:HK97 family phage prohead protease
MELETKFCAPEGRLRLDEGAVFSGYASLFDQVDQGGDRVAKGAFARALARLAQEGRQVKMLWQHDPKAPIGVWEEVREDARGLLVRGRLLTGIAQGAEAATLIEAGVLDGLSIGYRPVKARKEGAARVLEEIDLWEVSLVTFPMLTTARLDTRLDGGQKGDAPDVALGSMAHLLRQASAGLAARKGGVAPA